MTKVCILTTAHPLSDTRIFHKEAKSLVKMGYDVTLVVQHSHNEIIDGIKIVALSKPRNRIQRMTKTVWQAYLISRNVDADIYHFHDPELIAVGLLLKLHRKRVIYDVHEDVPRQVLDKYYLPFFIRRPVSLVMGVTEWIAAQAFEATIPATPSIAKRFPVQKTYTIRNYPIRDELVQTAQVTYTKRPPTFAYVGVIAVIRGAVEMVNALDHLADFPNVRLHLAGNCSPVILVKTLETLPGWQSVIYHGPISRQQVGRLLSEVRVGLVTLHPTPSYLESYPVKMLEYMSAGLPVIASDFPLWRNIVNSAGCGLLVDPLNPNAIADAMRWMLEHPDKAEAMGMSGRNAVEQLYNWDTEVIKLSRLYKTLQKL